LLFWQRAVRSTGYFAFSPLPKKRRQNHSVGKYHTKLSEHESVAKIKIIAYSIIRINIYINIFGCPSKAKANIQ